MRTHWLVYGMLKYGHAWTHMHTVVSTTSLFIFKVHMSMTEGLFMQNKLLMRCWDKEDTQSLTTAPWIHEQMNFSGN